MTQDFEIQPTELILAIIKGMNQLFFIVEEEEAKSLFKEIEAGEKPKILNFETKSGNFDCTLELDVSEYIGQFDFSAFRSLLASHLHNAAEVLKKNAQLNLFMNQELQELVFHHPGVVVSDDQVNLLVSSVRQIATGTISIKLMCLDPSQFKPVE
jgi:hypothetical protein